MSFIRWKDSYSIGVKDVDEQHKQLISMINHLRRLAPLGETNIEVKKIYFELADYAKRHMSTEERLMRSINYPEYESHKTIHAEFVNKIVDILETLKSGGEITVDELQEFLQNWFIDHIIKQDLKIRRFIEARGKTVAR